MYHIRRADNFEEKSLYAGTIAGFEAASIEAGFRTYHTGIPHEVYDDVHERVVNTFLPSAKPEKVSYSSAFSITKSLPGASVTRIIHRLELIVLVLATTTIMLLVALLGQHH